LEHRGTWLRYGILRKERTNNDDIHEGPLDTALPFNPGLPTHPRGTNVSFSNFTVNGNQGTVLDGNLSDRRRILNRV